MRILHSLADIQKQENAIVTIGTFDGVHRGHRTIFERLFILADTSKGKEKFQKTLVTFHPHPQEIVMSPKHPIAIQLLTTLDEKINLLQQFAFDEMLIIPFNKELSDKSAEQFVKDILVDRIDVKAMVVGYDHSFGKNREGNPKVLRQLGEKYHFSVTIVDPLMEENLPINSTRIRRTLFDGNVKLASKLLGRNYLLTGKVVEGSKRGRQLGFPTANLNPDSPKKVIPANGVYSVQVKLEGKEYQAVVNIGHRPSFDGGERVIEAHLLNFSDDIYGKDLTIEFQERIRDEQKFPTINQLTEQIQKDILAVRIHRPS